MSSYPPTPQRKACNCSDPCISTDDVYYAGPNLPNSGINTYNVLTEVIEKLDAIYAVPTLQKVTEAGNLTTLPIIADSFVKIGGDGDNILLDNGTTIPISTIGGNQNLEQVLSVGNEAANSITLLFSGIGSTIYNAFSTTYTDWNDRSTSLLYRDGINTSANLEFILPSDKVDGRYTLATVDDLPGNTQTLAETLVLGNNTGGTNIYLNDTDSLYLENGSYIQKGRYDFGAAGGVSRICSIGYEDMWQAGFRHVFDANGFIRNSTNCFNLIPDIVDDVTRRYKIGSIWTLDDLTNYICTDATEGAAVWELYKEIPIAPYKVYTALLTQIDEEAPVATVLENTIGNIVWSYNNIGVYTALSIGNFTVNKTAVFISSQGFGGGYGLVTSVNNANNGSQITITTQNSIGGVNGNLENTSIEIRVYN